jgi:centromere protein S
MDPDRYVQSQDHSQRIPILTITENVTMDLESFARHAGRTTITTDDVLLITRRNDALYDIMKDFIDKEKAKSAKNKERNRANK